MATKKSAEKKSAKPVKRASTPEKAAKAAKPAAKEKSKAPKIEAKTTKAKTVTAPEPAPAAVENVEQNILKVTGQKAKGKDEADQDYRERLAEAIDEKINSGNKEKDDANWSALSEASRAWFKASVNASENKAEFPSFEPAPAADKASKKKGKEKAAAAPAPEKAEKGSKKKEKAAKPEKVAKPAKPEKAAKAPKPAKSDDGKKKRTGGSMRVAAIVAENMSADFDVIMKKSKAEGITVADDQVKHVFGQTHRFAEVFRAAGLFKK